MTNVIWTYEAQSRLWHYIHAVKTEIGGFGYATLIDPETVFVTDVWLAPQYVSSSEVDFIDGDGVAYAIEKAAEDKWLGKDDFVWVSWHSHHTMKAYWSTTDETCIQHYGDQGIERLLSLVGNHKMEYQQRLDFFNVMAGGVLLPQITKNDLLMQDDDDDPLAALRQEWDEDIAEMVKKRPQKQWNQSSHTTRKEPNKGIVVTSAAIPEAAIQNAIASGLLDRNKATSTRTVQDGALEFWFPGGIGWVPESQLAPENKSQWDAWDDQTIERGARIYAAMENGTLDIMALSAQDESALFAYFDVMGQTIETDSKYTSQVEALEDATFVA